MAYISGGGIVGPGSYPIRDVKTRPQKVGRIVNPRGKDFEMGGKVQWRTNQFDVEKPTRVNATVRTASND